MDGESDFGEGSELGWQSLGLSSALYALGAFPGTGLFWFFRGDTCKACRSDEILSVFRRGKTHADA